MIILANYFISLPYRRRHGNVSHMSFHSKALLGFIKTAPHGGILDSYHSWDMVWHSMAELSIWRVHDLMYEIRHVPRSRLHTASVADIIPRTFISALLSACTAFYITYNSVSSQARCSHAHQLSNVIEAGISL